MFFPTGPLGHAWAELGAEENEPHHGQHQHGKPERDRKQGRDRGSELALPRLSRRFDDPVLVSYCHDALKSACARAGLAGGLRPPARLSEGNARRLMMFRACLSGRLTAFGESAPSLLVSATSDVILKGCGP
jgi:hypothetical protein